MEPDGQRRVFVTDRSRGRREQRDRDDAGNASSDHPRYFFRSTSRAASACSSIAVNTQPLPTFPAAWSATYPSARSAAIANCWGVISAARAAAAFPAASASRARTTSVSEIAASESARRVHSHELIHLFLGAPPRRRVVRHRRLLGFLRRRDPVLHEFHLLGSVHTRHAHEALLHFLRVSLLRVVELFAHAVLSRAVRVHPLRAVVAVLIVHARGFIGGGRRAPPQLARGLAAGAPHRAASLEAFEEPRDDLRIQLEHRGVELGRRAVLLRLLARDGLPAGVFHLAAEPGQLRLRDRRAEREGDDYKNQEWAGHSVSFVWGQHHSLPPF